MNDRNEAIKLALKELGITGLGKGVLNLEENQLIYDENKPLGNGSSYD